MRRWLLAVLLLLVATNLGASSWDEYSMISSSNIIGGRDTTSRAMEVRGYSRVVLWIYNEGTSGTDADSVTDVVLLSSMDGINFATVGSSGAGSRRHYIASDGIIINSTSRKVSGGITTRIYPDSLTVHTGATTRNLMPMFGASHIKVRVLTKGRRIGQTADSAVVVGFAVKAVRMRD